MTDTDEVRETVGNELEDGEVHEEIEKEEVKTGNVSILALYIVIKADHDGL